MKKYAGYRIEMRMLRLNLTREEADAVREIAEQSYTTALRVLQEKEIERAIHKKPG